MNGFHRRCLVLVGCSVAVFILYWIHSKHVVNNVLSDNQAAADDDDDDDDDSYDYNVAKLPSERAVSSASSSSQLIRFDSNVDRVPTATRHDNSDNDDYNNDYGSVRRLSHTEHSRYERRTTRNISDISSKRQLSTHMSALRRDLRGSTTVESLNLTTSLSLPSWRSLTTGHERLNHVLISEKRRLALQKERIRAHKLRFDKEVADIMQEMKKGGVLEVHKKPAPLLSTLSNVDSRHWQGLNMSYLHSHYPGIVPLKDYVMAEHLIINDSLHAAGMQGQPQSLDDMTDGQIENRFYQLVSSVHVDCLEMRRMGTFDDGGYDICTSQPYHFTSQSSCLVYSFGINFDFTFDDAMATAFSCTVKCFDPSMTVEDHLHSAKVHFYQIGLGAQNTVTDRGWKLMTLRSIQSKLGHTKTVIDILKIDVDYAEWSCLRQMVTDGSLRLVKQLIIEIHTSEVLTVGRPTSRQEFVNMYDMLAALECAGFRRYHCHYNPQGTYNSVRTGKTRTCCYELSYINIHFLMPT